MCDYSAIHVEIHVLSVTRVEKNIGCISWGNTERIYSYFEHPKRYEFKQMKTTWNIHMAGSLAVFTDVHLWVQIIKTN